MRARWYRIAVTAAVLMTLALLLAGSALAASITSFTPVESSADQFPACQGPIVQINGTGFASEGVTAVTFNGVTSPYFQVGSNVAVYAKVPAGATTGPISVTTSAGTATSTTNYTIWACPSAAPAATPASTVSGAKPAITSFTPAKAKAGAKVTVTGSGFTNTTAVKIGGVKAIFKVVSDTKMTTTVPKTAKSGKISITSAGGTSTSSTSFVRVG